MPEDASGTLHSSVLWSGRRRPWQGMHQLCSDGGGLSVGMGHARRWGRGRTTGVPTPASASASASASSSSPAFCFLLFAFCFLLSAFCFVLLFSFGWHRDDKAFFSCCLFSEFNSLVFPTAGGGRSFVLSEKKRTETRSVLFLVGNVGLLRSEVGDLPGFAFLFSFPPDRFLWFSSSSSSWCWLCVAPSKQGRGERLLHVFGCGGLGRRRAWRRKAFSFHLFMIYLIICVLFAVGSGFAFFPRGALENKGRSEANQREKKQRLASIFDILSD